MKKIITLFAVLGLMVFTSCEGPPGPPGSPGQDGYDGLLGVVYENTPNDYYNFTVSNGFKVRYYFPVGIYDSDVVLVYRLGGVDNGNAIWEFLPQTYYFDDGTRDFSYNFNFTFNYVDIYLSGNNLTDSELDDYRFDQIFRIVVVPADFASDLNKNSYLDVVSKLKIKESQIKKIK